MAHYRISEYEAFQMDKILDREHRLKRSGGNDDPHDYADKLCCIQTGNVPTWQAESSEIRLFCGKLPAYHPFSITYRHTSAVT